jgi:aspartate 1-decarboxylase
MEFRKFLRCKIHRATVTAVDVDYEGSISIDAGLMETAGIAEWEAVAVWDVTNGSRFETYAIVAPPGSGEIRINGAAAHLAKPGDLVIIACFSYALDEAGAGRWEPKIVQVDPSNRAVPKKA